jgi:site-specific recombinase XerC
MAETGRLTAAAARFVGALLTARSIRDAASAAHVSERAAYRYLAQPAVRAELAARQQSLLASVSGGLAADMEQARALLVAMMTDPAVPPGVRVRAALGVLDCGLRLAELVTLAERVAALEAATPTGVRQ